MNFEESRLRSFRNWPTDSPIDTRRIAKAGFYYMGQNMEVQCFACGGRISEWSYGDKVMLKHKQLDPRCPFVLNPIESGNVPITETTYYQLDTRHGAIFNRQELGGDSPRFIEQQIGDLAKYRTESARMETFATWPICHRVKPEALVKAGFFYLKHSDKVRCAFCGLIASRWVAGEDPLVEHRRHSPLCSFLCNLPVTDNGNATDEVLVLRESHLNIDTELGLDVDHMKDFGIINHRIPRHPEYMTEESRMNSFANWPSDITQTPQQLAKAGFYYTGVEDKVRCYHCDGGLRNWEPCEDPWVEHIRWFPDCDYVFLVKGQEFINQIKEQHIDIQYSEEGESEDDCKSGIKMLPPIGFLRHVTDSEIQNAMTSPIVMDALQIGLELSRVKQAVRVKLQKTGSCFQSATELIEATLDVQMEEVSANQTQDESWWNTEERETPFSSTVRRILNNISSYQQTANQSSENESEMDERGDDESYVTSSNEMDMSDYEILSEDTQSTDPPEYTYQNTDHPECTYPKTNPPECTYQNTDPPECTGVAEEPVTEEKRASLEEEVRQLKEARLCKVCMDREVNIVFLPCGHLVTCATCATNIPDCPVCRQIIKGTVRTFLS